MSYQLLCFMQKDLRPKHFMFLESWCKIVYIFTPFRQIFIDFDFNPDVRMFLCSRKCYRVTHGVNWFYKIFLAQVTLGLMSRRLKHLLWILSPSSEIKKLIRAQDISLQFTEQSWINAGCLSNLCVHLAKSQYKYSYIKIKAATKWYWGHIWLAVVLHLLLWIIKSKLSGERIFTTNWKRHI